MLFKNWLLHFSEVNLPIGDIARDVKELSDFPETNNREEIFSFIESKHFCDKAVTTFENAYDYFISENGPIDKPD